MNEATLHRGATVYSRDGARLGAVGETRPQHFQLVDAADGPLIGNAWLERSAIESSSADRVVVGFAADQFDTFRTGDPGTEHVVPATSRHEAYIENATEEEANELADPRPEFPQTPPEER